MNYLTRVFNNVLDMILLDKMSRSLLIGLMTISLVPLIFFGFYSYKGINKYLRQNAERILYDIADYNVNEVNHFFLENIKKLTLESKNSMNIKFLETLSEDYKKSQKSLEEYIKSNSWSRITDELGAGLRNFQLNYNYYDVFLIDLEGNILFSIKREDDLGTNILQGKYSESNFGKISQKVLKSEKTLISDFEFYVPSNNEVAAFIVDGMVNDEGKIIGLIALQLGEDQINSLLDNDLGSTELEEVYLLGPDLLMRSKSRHTGRSSILKKKVDTNKSRKWLKEFQSLNLESGSKQMMKKNEVDIYRNYVSQEVLGVSMHLLELRKFGISWGLFAEIEKDKAFYQSKHLVHLILTLLILTTIFVIIFSLGFTHYFIRPIRSVISYAKRIAKRDLTIPTILKPQNEIGELVQCFDDIVMTLREVTTQSKSISMGDFNNNVTVLSEVDELGLVLQEMNNTLRETSQTLEQISKGDFNVIINQNNDHDFWAISIKNMASSLRRVSVENEINNWFKTGQTELSGQMQGNKSILTLSRDLILYLAKYLDAQVGTLYVLQEKDQTLHLMGTYAFTKRKGIVTQFKLGEGLVGEAALEKELILITEIPNDYIWIESSLGYTTPKNILAIPLVLNEKTIGVIELGSVKSFSDNQLNFLKMVTPNIGISLKSAIDREQTERLLEKTQAQAEELESQQEELKVANEELNEQTKKLRISEEDLKSQQEELKVTNEELIEKTRALELQNNEVENKNKELEIIKRQVEEKAEALETTSKYKSEFLANMSHELRTPLNSQLLLSENLSHNEHGNLTDDQIKSIRMIHESGSDLLRLINDILDLSKIEAGKMNITIAPFSLEEMVQTLYHFFENQVKHKGLDFKLEISKDLPLKMESDQQRVQQILKNFISNSLKFTNKGLITIKVHRPQHSDISIFDKNLDVTNCIAFSIIDSGIGIPENKQPIIFEAFQQVDGSTSRQYGGTGLGLSISSEMAKCLGGKINLYSRAGEGSTFTLVIPECFESQTSNQNEKMTQASINNDFIIKSERPYNSELPTFIPDDRNGIEPSDKVLLIIEDEPKFATILKDMANKKGFKVLVAGDGRSGLAFVSKYKIDAITLDVKLPDIDGLQIMDQITSNLKTRHIPIHFISVSDMKEKALKSGAIGYLRKPASASALTEVLNKIEKKISSSLKKVLIIEDNKILCEGMVNLISGPVIKAQCVNSGEKAIEMVKNECFDCIVLDLTLQDISGFDFLKKIKNDQSIEVPSIIIYTGMELTVEQERELSQYAESIIVKGGGELSMERLLSELTLFLHAVDSDLTKGQRNMLRKIYNKDASLKDKNVLLVDDDARNSFALTKNLEEKGLKVIQAFDGKKSLEILDSDKFSIDIILMDIMMPEMDGYETIMEIRKKSRFCKLPIIALTAKAMLEDKDKCIKAGANDYLPKPIDIEKLFSLMRVWIQK